MKDKAAEISRKIKDRENIRYIIEFLNSAFFKEKIVNYFKKEGEIYNSLCQKRLKLFEQILKELGFDRRKPRKAYIEIELFKQFEYIGEIPNIKIPMTNFLKGVWLPNFANNIYYNISESNVFNDYDFIRFITSKEGVSISKELIKNYKNVIKQQEIVIYDIRKKINRWSKRPPSMETIRNKLTNIDEMIDKGKKLIKRYGSDACKITPTDSNDDLVLTLINEKMRKKEGAEING